MCNLFSGAKEAIRLRLRSAGRLLRRKLRPRRDLQRQLRRRFLPSRSARRSHSNCEVHRRPQERIPSPSRVRGRGQIPRVRASQAAHLQGRARTLPALQAPTRLWGTVLPLQPPPVPPQGGAVPGSHRGTTACRGIHQLSLIPQCR